jgi:tetratricopeptide (TPR) repeat protein
MARRLALIAGIALLGAPGGVLSQEVACRSGADALLYHTRQAAYHLALEEAQRALDHAECALRLDQSPILYELRGDALRQQGRYDEALVDHRRVQRLRPDSADAANDLGITLQRAGQLALALDAYQRAVTLDPADGFGFNNLGTALFALDRFDEAQAAFLRADELGHDPAWWPAANLGVLYARQAQWQDAVTWYRRAITLGADQARVYEELAKALVATGDADAAQVVYAEMAQIGLGEPGQVVPFDITLARVGETLKLYLPTVLLLLLALTGLTVGVGSFLYRRAYRRAALQGAAMPVAGDPPRGQGGSTS